jgi:hypothetical protein
MAFLFENKKNFFIIKRNCIQNMDYSANNELIHNLWKSTAKYSDGADHTRNDTLNTTLLLNIANNYRKMNLLKTLEDNNNSIEKKILLIEEYKKSIEPSIKAIDIKSGGLMKDWEDI